MTEKLGRHRVRLLIIINFNLHCRTPRTNFYLHHHFTTKHQFMFDFANVVPLLFSFSGGKPLIFCYNPRRTRPAI